MRHIHRTKTTEVRCWVRCVDPRHTGNHASHGHITATQRCRCGAIQKVEANQRWVGRSGWQEDTTDHEGIARNERMMARQAREE